MASQPVTSYTMTSQNSIVTSQITTTGSELLACSNLQGQSFLLNSTSDNTETVGHSMERTNTVVNTEHFVTLPNSEHAQLLSDVVVDSVEPMMVVDVIELSQEELQHVSENLVFELAGNDVRSEVIMLNPGMSNAQSESVQQEVTSIDQLSFAETKSSEEVDNVKEVSSAPGSDISTLAQSIEDTYVNNSKTTRLGVLPQIESHGEDEQVDVYELPVESESTDRAQTLLPLQEVKVNGNVTNKLTSSKQKHGMVLNKNPFKCTFCEMTCSTIKALVSHTREHHSITISYSCPHCRQACACLKDLRKHLKTHASLTGQFGCPYCQVWFPTEGDLGDHEKTHTDENPYTCNLCHLSFSMPNLLTQHSKSHRTSGPYPCPQCDWTFTKRNNLKRHMIRFHIMKGPNVCDRCDATFQDKAALSKHLSTHKRLTHSCEHCDAKFSSVGHMTRHLKKHVSDSSQPHICSLCNVSFTSQILLETHRSTHAKERLFPCEQCEWTFTNSGNLKRHIRRAHTTNRSRVCPTCNAEFATETLMEKHRRSHTARPFTCDLCDVTFAHRGYLTRHYKTHQQQDSPTGDDVKQKYECALCDVVFSCRSRLVTHVRSHTGERPYECDHCDQTFATVTNRNRHARIHDKSRMREKIYPCPECDKMFYEKANVRLHMRTHTGEKPYLCTICGMSLRSLNSYQCHMRTHTGEKPYKCSYCDVSFAQKGPLDCHLRIHTGDRPYKCNQCEAAFGYPNSLKRHLMVHTGIKPYFCQECSTSFADKVNLKRHLKNKHNNFNPIIKTVKIEPKIELSHT